MNRKKQMDLFALLTLFSSIACLVLGVSVYQRDTKNWTNRLFLFLNIALALWAFAVFGLCQASSYDEALIWRQLFSFWPLTCSFFVHFALLFTEATSLKKRPIIFAAIYAPSIAFCIVELSTYWISGPPSLQYWGWTVGLTELSFWNSAAHIWLIGSCILPVYLVTRLYLRVAERQLRKQARYFLIGIGVAAALTCLEIVLFLLSIRTPPFSVVSLIAACFFIGYAMWRYKLFTLTSRTAAENIVSTMSDALLLVDSIGKVISANNAAERLLRYNKDELNGRPLSVVLPQSGTLPWIERVTSGELDGIENLKELETTFVAKDGLEIPISLAGNILRDERNTFRGLLLIGRDITSRKQAENEKELLEEQFRQSQKMEAIGRLAGGVAHDMNNVLGAIMAAASLLRDDLGEEGDQTEDVTTILAACSRGRDLTRNLLGFARKGRYVRERVSLNHIVREVEALLKRTIPKKITVETSLKPELGDIECDASQIQHAIMNICINAIDAMRDRGRLVIKTENAAPDRSSYPMVESRADDGEPPRLVEVTVSDTGMGIDSETLPKVFEPFFTTKPKGKGTGLGLSMAYGVVKNHGGTISIESQPDHGTSVVIRLPALADQRTNETMSLPEPARAAQQSLGILIVDDEEMVLTSTERLLRKLGHRVLVAASGEQALEIYRDNKRHISLVLLDLIMPGMDGAETFGRLKSIDPNVNVLLCSGYSRDDKVEKLLSRGALGFMHKPFDLQAIADNVAKLCIYQ